MSAPTPISQAERTAQSLYAMASVLMKEADALMATVGKGARGNFKPTMDKKGRWDIDADLRKMKGR